MSTDRVFGSTEKEVVRHEEEIVDPKEYINIIGNYATVVMLGSDCQIFNWKQQ
jgi:hypothetical protein